MDVNERNLRASYQERLQTHFERKRREYHKEVEAFVFGVAVDEELQVWEQVGSEVLFAEDFALYLKANGYHRTWRDNTYMSEGVEFVWKGESVVKMAY